MYKLFFFNDPGSQSKRTNRVILLSSFLFVLFSIALLALANAQNNTLVLNGGYITLNGGTSTTPIYFVVNHNHPDAITRSSGAIISEGEYNKIQWNVGTNIGTYTFPLGKNTTTYVPLVFDKTTAGTQSGTGMVRVSSWYTANNATWPNTTSLCGTTEDNVADRFWLIDVLNYSANPTATIDFYYNTGEIQAIAEADLLAQRWNSSLTGSCKWETPPVGVVNTTSKYVRVSGISSFSPWTLVRQSAPLPIELLYFKARWKDQQNTAVQLEWKTTAEINNDYFIIQRATTPSFGEEDWGWASIKTVPGAGNSSQIISYSDFDNEPEKETTSYYRLKQVDYDGSYTYSNIETLNAPSGINLITIYPNPSSEFVDYLVYSSEDAEVSVWAVDAAGKLVISEKQELKKGVNKQRVYISYLSNGNYILQVTANENTKTEKQFIVR